MVTLYSEVEDQVWKALADGKRRRILDELSQGPRSTGDLVKLFPTIGRTGVMKHIQVLENASLIEIRREGCVRWNYLNPEQIEKTCSPWIKRHIDGLTTSIAHLKALAEPTNKH
ncbi:MAG: metalloregulator ArsR/SmtB family transcription factor [Pseudomonadota bacterium]